MTPARGSIAPGRQARARHVVPDGVFAVTGRSATVAWWRGGLAHAGCAAAATPKRSGSSVCKRRPGAFDATWGSGSRHPDIVEAGGGAHGAERDAAGRECGVGLGEHLGAVEEGRDGGADDLDAQ